MEREVERASERSSICSMAIDTAHDLIRAARENQKLREAKTTIFISVQPWDYSLAYVKVFDTREEAEEFINEVCGNNKHNSHIIEKEIVLKEALAQTGGEA
jgi:hypothetical protein